MDKHLILLVDDDLAVLASLKRTLRKEPYEIASVDSAARALEYLSREKPLLILSDNKMPDRDGVSLLTEVKERWPGIVRIMISGFIEQDLLIGAINKAEIFRFIPKPWDNGELVEILREAVERAETD